PDLGRAHAGGSLLRGPGQRARDRARGHGADLPALLAGGPDEAAGNRTRIGDRARHRGATRRPHARGEPARRGPHVLVGAAAGARGPGPAPRRVVRLPPRLAVACVRLWSGCARAVPAPPAPTTPLDGRGVRTGDVVSIANLAGELRVEPGTGPDVIVEA